MKQEIKQRYLCLALILGLILSFAVNPTVYAEDNDVVKESSTSSNQDEDEILDEDESRDEDEPHDEAETLPYATITGKPEGTIFQDLFQLLQEHITDHGYTLAEYSLEDSNNLVLAWTIKSDDEDETWLSEELILMDNPDSQKPLAEREISAMYTATTGGDVESLLELDSSLAQAFGIREADLLTSAATNIEDWGAVIEIEGTGSTLEYYYTLAPTLHTNGENALHHTLSAELKPIGYAEDSLLDALPKLADYLYETGQNWAEGTEQYYASVLVTETEPEHRSDGVNYHSIELIHSTYVGSRFVRHFIDFDNDVSLEASKAIITYLEDHTPDEITGLVENWEKSFESQEYINHPGDGWSAGFSALSDSKQMWVFYRLDPESAD